MSWYRMVDIRIHGDAKYLSLSPELPSGRTLFKHLLICEENGPLPGVIRAGAAALAEALEWSPEGLRERFGELFREGLAEADWKARLVFLPNGIKYNPPNNPNVIAGWAKHWDALPEGPLKTKIWHRFRQYFEEDVLRRKEEIERGERKKEQDPEAMLSAFFRAMPQPSGNQPETVTGTVPQTVTGTVDGSSAGAGAHLPEPEPELNPEPEQKSRRGSAEGAPPAPASGALTPEEHQKGKPPKFDPRSVPIPEILDTPEFREKWDLRLQERAEPGRTGAKPSESSIRSQLAKLEQLAKLRGLPAAIACVERATDGRHQGVVFPEDFEAPKGLSLRDDGRRSAGGHAVLPPSRSIRMVDQLAAFNAEKTKGSEL